MLAKGYRNGKIRSFQVWKDVHLEVEEGEFVGDYGVSSGSGKSTWWILFSVCWSPNEWWILLEGEEVAKLSEKKLNKVRNQQIICFSNNSSSVKLNAFKM